MSRNLPSDPVLAPLHPDHTHPLDHVGVPQTNGGKTHYDPEHSWKDYVFSHWDIRRFDLCTLEGEKIYAVETTEDMNEFPFTTLSRKRAGTIATYDWKGWGYPTKVLCARWTKRKKRTTQWMLASNYLKGRFRNGLLRR